MELFTNRGVFIKEKRDVSQNNCNSSSLLINTPHVCTINILLHENQVTISVVPISKSAETKGLTCPVWKVAGFFFFVFYFQQTKWYESLVHAVCAVENTW
ncbi:hypothetical protein GDO86_014547 [Hymenochirus boettgeri]|uniref:Uncharacterized protein n=1 Tax=Hymenochirus boettgeri TaxID=247094 RepID=A0A8T2JXJ2_9PIPI|nr:hypothetical protein GDO86_014547 [Hymenochirus boettgeri]